MTEWRDISSAPTDGEVFVGKALGNLCALCSIMTVPPKHRVKKRFFGLLPPKIETDEGGTFFYFAIPTARGYTALNMRPDMGWAPTHWKPLRDLVID